MNLGFHHNRNCLCCGNLEEDMVLVGTLVFCGSCFIKEFESTDPVRKETEKYKYWLEIAHKELLTWLDNNSIRAVRWDELLKNKIS